MESLPSMLTVFSTKLLEIPATSQQFRRFQEHSVFIKRKLFNDCEN